MANERDTAKPGGPDRTPGDTLHPAYDDKVRKAVDNQGEVRPEDYPERKVDGPA